jgi:ubiquinone/menaquinone biosynthesis C-methylase UbiE
MLFWTIIGILLIFLALILIFGLPRKQYERIYELEGIYDPDVAEAFEKMNDFIPFKILRSKVISRIKKYNPRGLLVDVGCGSGRLLIQIAKKINNLNLIGVDVAKEMIGFANEHVKSYEFEDRIELREGSVEKLPLNDNSIDFIVSTLSLHHWENPIKAFEEFFRILKDDGILLIFDFRRDSRNLCFGFLKFITRVIVPKALKKVGEPLGSLQASYSLSELNEIVNSTAFEKAKFDDMLCWIFLESKK